MRAERNSLCSFPSVFTSTVAFLFKLQPGRAGEGGRSRRFCFWSFPHPQAVDCLRKPTRGPLLISIQSFTWLHGDGLLLETGLKWERREERHVSYSAGRSHCCFSFARLIYFIITKRLAEEWVSQNSHDRDDLRSDGTSTRPYVHMLFYVNKLETPRATHRITGA